MSKLLKCEWHRAMSKSELPDITKLVAFALWDFTDPQGGNAHPGNKLLASITGKSLPTIKRHITALRDAGWIVRVEGSNCRDGQRTADVYKLALPAETGIAQEIPNSDPSWVSENPESGIREAPSWVSPERSPNSYLPTVNNQQIGVQPRANGGTQKSPPARVAFEEQSSSTELGGW